MISRQAQLLVRIFRSLVDDGAKREGQVTTLVVGASGATGQRLVAQLLARGEHVRIVVRPAGTLPGRIAAHPHLTVIRANVLELDAGDLARVANGCESIASCLGHRLSLQGLFGPPRRLVADATRRLCAAARANAPERPVRFVLMNTTGNRNRDLDEPVSRLQRLVVWLLRHLLPPHADNEEAADYLRSTIGQHDPYVEWVVVRPDSLHDAGEVTPCTVHPSPTRSAVFDAGSTSRINVGHFMAELIASDDTWGEWTGRMPVIYDAD